MESKVRPILMSTDEAFYSVTCVAIASIYAHMEKPVGCEFIILIPHGLSTSARRALAQAVGTFPSAKLALVEVNEPLSHVNLNSLPETTYYRLFAAHLLPHVDQCVYLDSDVVLRGDISKLFDYDIGDQLVAGVKAPSYHTHDIAHRAKLFTLGFAALDQYINAGVLVMNLVKMRMIDFDSKVHKMLAKTHFPECDQDVLNLLCYNDIAFMPYRFNYCVKHYHWVPEQYNSAFSNAEIHQAKTDPLVVHFAGDEKPWDNMDMPLASWWWDECSRSCQRAHFMQRKKENDNFTPK